MFSANARLPRALFLLTAVCASIYFSYHYPLLPKVVASHFDVHGTANGWQTKYAFFEVLAGTTALSAFLVFGIPTMIAVMPSLINLPNKDYWLAPGQLAASLEFLSGWFAWFGYAVYIVIILAFDYAMQMNLRSASGPNPARLWYTLAGLAVFTVIWTIRLFGRFGRLPRTPDREGGEARAMRERFRS
jgi:uncharacterized membrane protein